MTPLPPLTAAPPAGADNTAWKHYANCAGQELAVFYKEAWERNDEAKAICADCTVRQDCLEYALDLNIQSGVWGGKSVNERRQIRADRYRGRLASPPVAGGASVAGGETSAARTNPASRPAAHVRAAHP